jgi:lysophospholipid acyltransferase (LPLAT)-like uncharacterized protein
MNLVRAVSRFQLEALEPARIELSGRSCIVATLHRESLLHIVCPYNRHSAILARDQGSAGLYSRLARSFGFHLIEQVGPMPPLRQALEFLAVPGSVLVVAVDGPAGPPGIAKRGVVELARLSGAPVVPVRCSASHAIRLTTTWDLRLLPLPGDAFVSVAGVPVEVPLKTTRREVDSLSRALSATLAALAA